MLYLYHAPSSVCAMKVRLVLNEKGLPWDGKILDLRRGDSGEPLGRRRLDDAAENIDGHAVFPHRARLVNQERLGDALDLLGRRHAAGVVLVNTRLGELGLDVGRR
jgi:Glutathione S-transferase, N-terminal domain